MNFRSFSIMGADKKSKGFALICTVLITAASLSSCAAPASSANNDAPEYIGESKAKSIALEHAGISETGATFVKALMDYDDGRAVYDVEFYSDNIEYDYEIDALSGDIVSYDREIEDYMIPNVAVNTGDAPGDTPAQHSQHSAPGNAHQDQGQVQGQAQGQVQGQVQYIGEAKAKEIALSAAGLAESQVYGLKAKFDREDGMDIYEVEFSHERIEYDYEIDAVSGTIVKTDIDYDD